MEKLRHGNPRTRNTTTHRESYRLRVRLLGARAQHRRRSQARMATRQKNDACWRALLCLPLCDKTQVVQSKEISEITYTDSSAGG